MLYGWLSILCWYHNLEYSELVLRHLMGFPAPVVYVVFISKGNSEGILLEESEKY